MAANPNTSVCNDAESKNMAKQIEDLKMEYRIKYERLTNIHQEMQTAYVESQKNTKEHKEAYEEFVKQLEKDIFDKDMEIYNLKQENDDLKSKNSELEAKFTQMEASNVFVNSKVEENNSNLSTMNKSRKSIIESPVVPSSLPKIDMINSLCLPSTPRCVSKLKRFSIMNETIEKASPSEQGQRDAFLKRVVIDQKELLDFYATLTGYMAWKEKLPENVNEEEQFLDYFKIKPLDSKLKDVEIQFLVDYEQDDIEYHPVGLPDNEDGSSEKFSSYLRKTLYLSSQMAPKLLKALLDVIET